MRQVRRILEYRFDRKLSVEQTGLALNVAKGTVSNTLQRFEQSGLSWPLSAALTDSALEQALYPVHETPEAEPVTPHLPDVQWIERELRRPHVTLQRLWEEYQANHPGGLSRSAFYRYWEKRRPKEVSLKMIHKGGDKLFVDYSGDGPSYVDKNTGELIEARMFVACWGASSYIYAEATATEGEEDLVRSHVRAFDFFGVAPHGLVPDNLKSGVAQSDRYEPRINGLYQALASHYGAAVLPARVRKPKDKAAVESAVLQAQRFILARLRDRQFFSMQEINDAIREELELLNNRPMKDYGGQTRKMRFELLDKPHARPLPEEPFKITHFSQNVRVEANYHFKFDDHYYSLPYRLAGARVDIYQAGDILEIYHDGVHVMRHRKGPKNFTYTTLTEHMPAPHQYVRHGWTEDYFLDQAEAINPIVRTAMESLMKKKTHPQQAFNAAKGVLRLATVYTPERLINACRRALRYNSASYQTIKSILEQSLDKQIELTFPQPASQTAEPHDNLRGTQYYAG